MNHFPSTFLSRNVLKNKKTSEVKVGKKKKKEQKNLMQFFFLILL